MRRVLAAGVPLEQITLSSDSNVSMPVLDDEDEPVGLHNAPPTILHREFVEILKTNELSLSEGLPLVTTNVARVLKIDNKKGSIAVGKDADIVLLTPELAVDTVIARGAVLVENGEPVAKGPYEDR